MFVIFSRNDFMLSTWQVTRQVPLGPMHLEVSMICTMPMKVVKLIVTETFVIVHITQSSIVEPLNVADSHQ